MDSTNTLGKYQILREIARSNDIVYEAIDPALGRRVALKELNLPSNLVGAQKRERIERFLREGKAAGQLAHPNIVTIYDVGQEGDRFYIAMEFLGGQTLREVLQMRGALPVKEAVDITLSLCSALSYAHQNNVVHRDVKPENVQILPGGHVKLTDFGIARIMSEPSITQDGQVFGTPSYMSPEQVSGKDIDGRSDIFSVGVLLYEMLAGQKPFTGDTVVTITYNIMNSEPAPPPGVPPYLVGVVRKAMSKDPNLRYQNVEELIEDLRNPPQNNLSDPYTDPFGAPMPGPQSYGPPTTYSPMPPQAPSPQHAPDPFAQAPSYPQTQVPDPFGQASSAPPPPPVPRRPILSRELRTLFGAMFLVVGLAGLFVLAIWATMQAYATYEERTITDIATKYINQGDALMQEGKTDEAMVQYEHAKRAAGTSKAGAQARRRLAQIFAKYAGEALSKSNYTSVRQYAERTIDADSTYSAGHYYKGVADAHFAPNDPSYDNELRKAIETGGNDDFAQAARKHLCNIYFYKGAACEAVGNTQDAKTWYRKITEDQTIYDPEIAQKAQERLTALEQ